MFKYLCHKTYLHDFNRRGDLRRLRELTEAEADDLLAASSFVKPDEDGVTPPHGLILNKGFCVVERVRGDYCLIVYNHDGNYALWEGLWSFFSEDIGL